MTSFVLVLALAGLPVEPSSPKVNRAGWIATSASLMAAGHLTPLVKSVAYWSDASWGLNIGMPLVSSIPVVGSVFGIVSHFELTRGTGEVSPLWIIDAAALAAQAAGIVLMFTMPRVPPKSLAVTSFGATPITGGVTCGIGGTF